MNKIREFLESRLVPVTDKITSNRYVKIMMDGFMGIGALTIGASFFTLIRSLPLGDAYTEFLMATGLYDILNLPILITSELTSLYLILVIGYHTAKSFGKKPINGSLIALGSLLMLTPLETMGTFTTEGGETITSVISNVIPTSMFGAGGIFLAMIVGVISVRIYVFFDDKGFKIKMPSSVPENVTNMFETMIPATIIFVIFMLVRIGCSMTSYETAQNLIYTLIQTPLTHIGGGYWGAFLYLFLMQFLWLFGIHGSMLMYVAMGTIANAMWTENMVAFANGMAAPNPEWMYMYFVNLGGSGATFGLVLLMMFKARSKHLKTLGKIVFPTSLFNINEPVIFGTPMVMNPALAIPFVLTPAINFFLTSFVNLFGFSVVSGALINNYFPVGVIGAFATSSWTGVVWMLALVVIDLIIYYPFFRMYDAQKVREEEKMTEMEEEDQLI